jgi:hypothetical protein
MTEQHLQACTLPQVKQPLRVAEFDAFFARAVRAVNRPARDRLLLELAFSPPTAALAAELMARESGCCSFFAFTLRIADGTLTLELKVPDQQIAVLDALQARAEQAHTA